MSNSELRRFLDKVRGNVDIAQVIGQHVRLDSRLWGLCPFHKDNNPSFHVHKAGQFFKCFGCGIGGDVFKFLILFEKKGFMDVVKELASGAGVANPSFTSQEAEDIEKRRIYGEILSEAVSFYHGRLTHQAKAYLTKERGFTEKTIKDFQIGYADGTLRDFLLKVKEYPAEACIQTGLLKQGDDGVLRDYFYKRIIFPNIRHGKAMHLTGRCLDNQEPKYIHMPGKIKYLFNEDMLYEKMVLIAEGIPDCIAAVQAGYSSVGIYGTGGFKDEYIHKFERCERIYICMDADSPGESAALKIAEKLGNQARIIRLPDGFDLNDYFREYSNEDFEKIKKEAEDLIKYKINCISPETNKVELAERLKPILLDISKTDPATAEAYLSHVIKTRFDLKKDDIDAYRRLIKKESEESKAKRNKSSSKNDTAKYTAHFDGLIDLVSNCGEPAFLVRNGDGVEIQSEVEIDGDIFTPPPKVQIPWLLPRGEKILEFYNIEQELTPEESDGALYDDLRDYHKRISELPSDEYYDFITAWDFHTYLREQIQYTPIICLFAVPERGKTRTGKGIINLAYRGIHVESLRDAYIIRVANDLQATLFFDVKDIWRKAEKNGSEDILLLRFEKGSKVPRVLYPERGAHRDMVYYEVFGPTIIGTNEPVHRILGTRAIQINMPETSKQFENDVTPELALPLKERLVCFRARHMEQSLPDRPKPALGRLGDILKPIFQIISVVRPNREAALINLIEKLEGERRLEKSETIEAQILEAALALRHKVEHGLLQQKEILSAINEDRSERHKFTPQLVGKRLSALGIKKAKMSDGTSAMIWDSGQLERIAEKYGLSKSSVTSVTSASPGVMADETDHTEDTEVLINTYQEDIPLWKQ
ncbi:MAG: CHC2 zinc finger domain-containing protein [candidate division Zixibacteria bacterium]